MKGTHVTLQIMVKAVLEIPTNALTIEEGISIADNLRWADVLSDTDKGIEIADGTFKLVGIVMPWDEIAD